MGLGPVICPECLVYAELKQDAFTAFKEWCCPQCGNEHSLDYLWMFTDEEQKRTIANSKFIRFVQGKT